MFICGTSKKDEIALKIKKSHTDTDLCTLFIYVGDDEIAITAPLDEIKRLKEEIANAKIV